MSAQATASKSSANNVLPDGILRLDDWLPYRTSVITNRVSSMLAQMYSEAIGISVVEWRLLANIQSFAPLSAKDLAQSVAMDQVSVTRALALLVDKRLVSRRVDATDRRKVVLRLTKAGLDAYREVAPLAKAIERELLAGLTDAESDTLHRLLEKVAKRADESLTDRAWRDLLSGPD